MRFNLLLLLFSSFFSKAQHIYPQDYFGNPLEIPIILSGTFAELRSNHFHSGLDIKTQQRSGLKVLAVASGYVSRIKISHFGYGKALYIKHPNGYTSVYAHLQKFTPEIEAYVKQRQYEKESYEIELFPAADQLSVTKSEVIAYSGNSGGSNGPHLHFEIRNKNEHPINPLLFGIHVKDNTAPVITSIYAYPLNKESFVNQTNNKQKLRIIPIDKGVYNVESIEAIGTIGFGIETFDRQDLAANKNGVYNIQTFVNGTKNFEIDFHRFSFNETKHINKLIDYEHFTTEGKRLQKLFEKNNPLSMLSTTSNSGFVTLKDSTYTVYKVKVSDIYNNHSWITVNIKGSNKNIKTQEEKKLTPYFIKANQSTTLDEESVTVNFYKNTFYDDFYIDFDVKNDTLWLHKDIIPTKKKFNIRFDINNYAKVDKNKLYIAKLQGYKNKPYYVPTKRNGQYLNAWTQTLGKYTLAIDTVPPHIKPLNFKNAQWLSKYRYLKLVIDDGLSGISNYRATINGKWVLMAYDYKTKTLTYDFNDRITTDTKNNLKVIVTDNVGNNSTFEALFYRK